MFDRSYFDKPEWLNQANDGGFSRGPAWLDLLALTNQKSTTAFVRGISIAVERGQSAYSKLGLATRWGRSQGWVTTTLTIWEKDGRIKMLKSDNETTVINITNFDSWQVALLSMLTPNREQIESSLRPNREQIETEKEKEKELPKAPRGEGEGEGRGEPPRIVTLGQAQKYFQQNESGYSSDVVREQWLYYDALRDPKTGDWQKPRGATGAMTRISDWRSELAAALLRFGHGKKNGGDVSATVLAIQDGKRVQDLQAQIRAGKAEVENLRALGQDYRAEKKSVETLMAELDAVKGGNE